MKTLLSAALLTAMVGGTLSAQNDSLMFTVLAKSGPEFTLSGSSGTQLGILESQDVAIVRPNPAAGFSAEKFASEKNWQTLMGDGNGDALYYELPLFENIDAILALHPTGTDPKIRDIFLSPSVPVGVPCGRAIMPGDVAAIRPSGTIDFFITGPQIASALGMPDPANVDAIMKDGRGNICLSFEEDEFLLGGAVLLEDGGIAIIPNGAITYNADCTVNSVVAGSGFPLMFEPLVDAHVANSNYANPFGFMPGSIEDVDGLTEDPNGGSFNVVWAGVGYNIPNLWFTGEATPGAVISTAGGGTIAVMNGSPLGSVIASTGPHVGLMPQPVGVGSLNGLHRVIGPYCRFILDSPNVDLSAGPALTSLDWGGADPFANVLFFVRIPPRFGCFVANSTPVAPICFPEQMNVLSTGIILASDAAGFGSLPLGPAGGTGVPAIIQAITNKPALGGIGWSAPLTFEF